MNAASVMTTEPRSAAERIKLLRYCQARLRAWISEYELYSQSPVTQISDDSPIFVSEPTERTSEPVTEEPCLMDAELRRTPSRKSAENMAHFAGSIDTATVPMDKLAPHRESRRPSHQKADVYNLDSTPEEDFAPASRAKSIEPLPSLSLRSIEPTSRTTIDKLRVPRVVNQILGDVPDHWEHLAGALEARVREADLGTLLVTSALKGEGATTVATALAIAAAQHTELKVLLLEADFVHPSLATQLRLSVRVGLEHHLLENVSLADTIVKSQSPSLGILPILEPFELPSLASTIGKLEEVLDRLRSVYDLVVIDMGSLFQGRRPLPIPAGIDATLIVRDPSKSGPELLDQLDSYIARQHVPSLGVIENGVSE